MAQKCVTGSLKSPSFPDIAALFLGPPSGGLFMRGRVLRGHHVRRMTSQVSAEPGASAPTDSKPTAGAKSPAVLTAMPADPETPAPLVTPSDAAYDSISEPRRYDDNSA